MRSEFFPYILPFNQKLFFGNILDNFLKYCEILKLELAY